ncbi:MAG: hypothetical protein HXS44_13135 [Theionarchaea archaeon]|nr:hypothetical protein [Theionarchaea archaeon]
MKKINAYDILAVLIITVTTFALLVRFDIFPVFVDIYYHTSVVVSFDKVGGIVLWDFWEFAPAGRPHLYPPLLHSVMLLLSEFADYMTVAKFTSFIMVPLSQMTVWVFSRDILSRKTGFYSVLVLTSSVEYFRLQVITSAAALVLVLVPLAFYAFEKKKYVAAVIILTSCLYTHVSMGPLVVGSFLLYGVLEREKLREAAKIITMSLILYLPWGIHLLINIGSLSSNSPPSSGSLMIFPLIFGITGIVICMKRKKEFLIPVCILVCMIPIAFSYPGRFAGHSVLPLALLSGVALSWMDSKIMGKKKMFFVLGALLVLSVIAPTISMRSESRGVQQQSQQVRLQQLSQQLLQHLPQQQLQQEPPQGRQLQESREREQKRFFLRTESLLVSLTRMQSDSYLTADNLKMAEIVRRNSQEREIVFIPGGIMGCFVTATTGRPQTLGMWQEVASDYEPDPKSASVFVLPREGRIPRELVKLGETDRWLVFRAPQKQMVDIPDATIPKGVVYVVMVAAFCTLVYDFLHKRRVLT